MPKSSKKKRSRRSRRTISLLLICVVILVGIAASRAYSMFPLEYEALILEFAGEFGVSPAFVAAVMKAESGFRANVKSSAGAKGLMQLTDDTFRWLQMKAGEQGLYSDDDIFIPEVNIRYGVMNLSILLEEFEDERTVLAAYNAGPSRVRGWLKNEAYSGDGKILMTIPYEETRSFANKVLFYRDVYTALYRGRLS